MKANELMIGDWVNIYVFPNDEPKGDALFPARINAILGDSEDVECKFALNGEDKVGYASRPARTCLPIPLTPEILEKNGFRECVWNGQNAWSRDYLVFNSVTICIDGRDGGLKHFGYLGYQSKIVIDYVHHLQHARTVNEGVDNVYQSPTLRCEGVDLPKITIKEEQK